MGIGKIITAVVLSLISFTNLSYGVFVISAVDKPGMFDRSSETVYHYEFSSYAVNPDFAVKVSSFEINPDLTMKLVSDPRDADLIIADDLSNFSMKVCKANSLLASPSGKKVKTIKVSSYEISPDITIKLATVCSEFDYKIFVQSERFTKEEAAALFAVVWASNRK